MRRTTTNTRPSMAEGRTIAFTLSPAKVLLLCALLALAVVLVLVELTSLAEILKKVDLGNGQPAINGEEGQITGLEQAINQIQGPANVAVGSLGGLGVAGGAAMFAVGSSKGLKILGSGAGALAALGLGNGLIA